ncbi:hypothetical protein C8J56DRAFT_896365 [Mycena floridula]|nr:hypothetical protein C8J56DRAFT_896365 [Mycena floridula]
MSGDSERTQSHDYYDVGNHRSHVPHKIYLSVNLDLVSFSEPVFQSRACHKRKYGKSGQVNCDFADAEKKLDYKRETRIRKRSTHRLTFTNNNPILTVDIVPSTFIDLANLLKFHQFADLAINPIVSPLPPRAELSGRMGGEERRRRRVLSATSPGSHTPMPGYFDIGKPREEEPEEEKNIGNRVKPTNRTEELNAYKMNTVFNARAPRLEFCCTPLLDLALRFLRPLPKPLDKSTEWLVGVLPLDSASKLGGGEDDQPRSLTLRSLRLDDCQLRHPALEPLCRGIRGSGVRNIDASSAIALCFAKLDPFTWIPI